MNGEMTQQWTVWCSYCTHWDCVSGNKKNAELEFRKNGWIKKNKIWICPSCTKNNKLK